MADWVSRMETSPQMTAHREAFGRFRGNRKSDRKSSDFDPLYGWAGARYIALHTLSHLLIRTIALECGYNSASLAERIYAGDDSNPRTGILIYTAVPDSEGTLGGLVSSPRSANSIASSVVPLPTRPTVPRIRCARNGCRAIRLISFTEQPVTFVCSCPKPPASEATGSSTGAFWFRSPGTRARCLLPWACCREQRQVRGRSRGGGLGTRVFPYKGSRRTAGQGVWQGACADRTRHTGSQGGRRAVVRRGGSGFAVESGGGGISAGVCRGLSADEGFSAGQNGMERSIHSCGTGAGDCSGAGRGHQRGLPRAARHDVCGAALPSADAGLDRGGGEGVRTDMVVETLTGARGLLVGREPAEAFASLPGLRLWHWARDPSVGLASRQHAKLAVADRRLLFLGSANLTQSAARRNIEAGVLVRGGDAPQRVAEHIVELQRRGVLQPLRG